MTSTPRVVVVGGGYADVLAANRLSQHADIEITLVNPRPASSNESGSINWSPATMTPSRTTRRSSQIARN